MLILEIFIYKMTPIQFFNHGNKDNCLMIDFNFPDKSRWKINRQFNSVISQDFYISFGAGMDETNIEKHFLVGDKLYLYFSEPIFQMDFDTHAQNQFTIDCKLNNPTLEENKTLSDMINGFGRIPRSEDRKASVSVFRHKYPTEIELRIAFVYDADSISKLIKNRTIKYLYT